ncbi:hypothetical protein Ahy_B05g075078 [Arachis hypogaea]|uniref:CCHC-type domain-containing protein n=1 Tax=Arachis hypogaea TaxID=3818 RepID=A0A444Z0F4_ARAHY|nr:hypothetical protein Ahy_B05g075078 [Arachis hypogaea]
MTRLNIDSRPSKIIDGRNSRRFLASKNTLFLVLNELFTRKSAEAHERVCNGFTYLEFATKRVEESFRRAENIVVNWFDRRNEMFEVIANWTLRRATKERPKSTRYLNEMDSRDMRGPRRCTVCGREGHSRSRCPQHAGPSTAGGH